MKKVICFDIDGVICKTKGNNYKKSKPIKSSIKAINSLKKNFYIIIFTARFDYIVDDKAYNFKKNWYKKFNPK